MIHHTWIPLQNRINSFWVLFFVFSETVFLFGQTEIHNRIEEFLTIFESEPLEIVFDYEIRSDNFKKKESWNIILHRSKNFRIQMGPKILVSNGIEWRMFDRRTNQILIQDRDTVFENSIMKWLKLSVLESIQLDQINHSQYNLKLSDKGIINVSIDRNEFNISFLEGEFTHYLHHLNIKEYKGQKDYYTLNIPDAYILDIRSNK